MEPNEQDQDYEHDIGYEAAMPVQGNDDYGRQCQRPVITEPEA